MRPIWLKKLGWIAAALALPLWASFLLGYRVWWIEAPMCVATAIAMGVLRYAAIYRGRLSQGTRDLIEQTPFMAGTNVAVGVELAGAMSIAIGLLIEVFARDFGLIGRWGFAPIGLMTVGAIAVLTGIFLHWRNARSS